MPVQQRYQGKGPGQPAQATQQHPTAARRGRAAALPPGDRPEYRAEHYRVDGVAQQPEPADHPLHTHDRADQHAACQSRECPPSGQPLRPRPSWRVSRGTDKPSGGDPCPGHLNEIAGIGQAQPQPGAVGRAAAGDQQGLLCRMPRHVGQLVPAHAVPLRRLIPGRVVQGVRGGDRAGRSPGGEGQRHHLFARPDHRPNRPQRQADTGARPAEPDRVDHRAGAEHRRAQQQPPAQKRLLGQPGSRMVGPCALPDDARQEQQERQAGTERWRPHVVHGGHQRADRRAAPGTHRVQQRGQRTVRERVQREQHQVVPDDGAEEPGQDPRPVPVGGRVQGRIAGQRETAEQDKQVQRMRAVETAYPAQEGVHLTCSGTRWCGPIWCSAHRAAQAR